jgi:hypothetical protein
MFDTSLDEKQPLAAESSDFVVPANMPSTEQSGSPPASTVPPPPLARREKKARSHAQTAVSTDIDEYFREGEEKSRAEDHAPSPKPASGIPPPPKAGTPKPAE